MRRIAIVLALVSCSRSTSPSKPPAIIFRSNEPHIVDSEAMKRAAGVTDIEGFDPYYQRKKHFRGYELAKTLVKSLDLPIETLRKAYFVMRAKDGYEVPISGERLLEPGAFIAFEDVDVPAWEPIGPQRAHPGPFYLVWREQHQGNLDTYPRPWQLAAIEVTTFELVYPHVTPPKTAAAPALRGFDIFKDTCIRCHAINREGGHVGPDLNVPKSIVEYREAAQIKAYVRNPLAFRYGNMPAHLHLSEVDLDALVFYFKEMSQHKHDDPAKNP